ncbi:HNH endonuclease [Rhizobium sp. EC-SD404]|nr:HNH endonuclease [Rhizobium sp. EC-SD404]
MPTTDDFVAELNRVLSEAASRDLPVTDVNAGWLHRRLGGYPGRKHAMPTCCDVLYGEMKVGDEILSRPPKGRGATLTFRYRLPRQR